MEGLESAAKSLSVDPLLVKFSSILPSFGVIVDEIRDEVPESLVSQYFGPKASKSGWKYSKHSTPEEAAAIYSLWTKVYDDTHMPNKEITLQFARGLIMQQTQPVNWVDFAVKRQRYREQLRESKKLNSGKVDEGLGGVQVFGKKRLQAARVRKEVSLPTVVKLTLKEEVEDGCAIGKKVISPKLKAHRVKQFDAAPRWVPNDLDAISGVIESTKRLLAECRVELEERLIEVQGLEGQSRRAKIMLSDRVVMLEDEERELANLNRQHTLLQSKVQDTEFSSKGGSSEGSSSLEDLSLSIALAAKSIAHCRTIVGGCGEDLRSVETRLCESLERQENVQSRVSGLERLLIGMQDQSKKMSEGTGLAFFPRPLGNNPKKPQSEVHVINACPVCGYWFSCNNFVPLGCGHTYHGFCLAQHASTSSLCSFQDCREEFSADSIISIGICISKPIGDMTYDVKVKDTEDNQGRKLRTVGTGTKPRLSEISRQALQVFGGTPSTLASTPQNTQPCSESSQRREENTLGTDRCGIISFSDQDMPPQNHFNQSQSSVSSMAANGLCTMCKSKPSSVSLMACGHDTFCFKCISGVEKCPLCSKEIAGWVPLQQKSSVRPSLFSTAPVVEDREDSDNEDSAGLVHWCDEDVFLQGGVRTVVGNDAHVKTRLEVNEESPKESLQKQRPIDEAEESPDRVHPLASQPQRTFSRRVVRTLVEDEPMVAVVETQSAKRAVPLAKKRGRLSVDVETLNHTRLMERPLTEILVEAPLATESVCTSREKRSYAPSTFVGKKLRTGTTRANQCRLTVPAKFRD